MNRVLASVVVSLVGCGPSHVIVLSGDLTPEIWERVGDEPASLYVRVEGPSPETRVIGAYCPGDVALDEGVTNGGAEPTVYESGCRDTIVAEVWLAPDSAIPSEDPLLPALECDDPQRLVARDPAFAPDGWPSARVTAYPPQDGSPGLGQPCGGFRRREVVLE
ncbi:MAG: hypothetical protein ABMA64_22955 [Myxococcota bacterium]